MIFSDVRFVLTDIEGTTTSVDFVYETLFPYFRKHLEELLDMTHMDTVRSCFEESKELAKADGLHLISNKDVILQLHAWSVEDRKVTPLKQLQGILWKKGYASGEIKGHVFDDVQPALNKWKAEGLELGVYSSGSIEAQKLIFGHSIHGDLTPYFSAYFDTNSGHKREIDSYKNISSKLNISEGQVLFLSDIKEELEAAQAAGMQTCQLVREKNKQSWQLAVANFNEITIRQ